MRRRSFFAALPAVAAMQPRFRLVIAGLAHGHARGFIRSLLARPDIELAGIADPDASLHAVYAKVFNLPAETFSTDLAALLDKVKPQAVAAFSSTADHAEIVRLSAQHRLPVMMEKPLAVSREDAAAIAESAAKFSVPVIVNYETTWYRSHAAQWREVRGASSSWGAIRKMVAMHGHQGPREIGVGPEFFRWLTDPKLNGAGALFDFGCYGANLFTWLKDNRRPVAVTARVQTFKPSIYPRVDDNAVVMVEYPDCEGIIQASWNWPYNRKDLEIYTESGYIHSTGGQQVNMLRPGTKTAEAQAPPELPADESNPLSYLKAIAEGRMKPSGLSSLENNLIVTDILCAARDSARSGRAVKLG